MNFKLKNIEDYKSEINTYILQTNILIDLNSNNNYSLFLKISFLRSIFFILIYIYIIYYYYISNCAIIIIIYIILNLFVFNLEPAYNYSLFYNYIISRSLVEYYKIYNTI